MDKQALLLAINRLINHPKAREFYDTVQVAASLPAHLKLTLLPEAAELAPLVELLRDDKEAFGAVMELVDRKRAALGSPGLHKPAETGFDKAEYQRAFMANKRIRERRAAELENAVRPGRDQLIGNARLEFMRVQSARWKAKRDQLVEAARAANGKPLSKEQLRQVLHSFWESVDAELDEIEVNNRRRMLGA